MSTAAFDYHRPASIDEAIQLLQQHGEDAKLLAGGHSLVPAMKLRLATTANLIDIGHLDALKYIREDGNALAIGAATTHWEIESSDLVKEKAPLLAQTAAVIGDLQVRNKGTIGGSLAHADPAGDLPAVVVALAAKLVTSSTGDHRTIEADDFFVDLLTTDLRPTEILSEISIPGLPPHTGTAYAKFGNKASHYAVVGVAAVVTVGADGVCQSARIGVTGAGPKAVRAASAEDALTGSNLDDSAISAAAGLAGDGITDFNEDVHASAEYRAHLVTVYAARAIRAAASRAS